MNTRTYVTYGQRLVKSADGTEISADAIGNRAPECPVIVLIHGFSMLKEVFNPMFEDSKWTQNNFLVSEITASLFVINPRLVFTMLGPL